MNLIVYEGKNERKFLYGIQFLVSPDLVSDINEHNNTSNFHDIASRTESHRILRMNSQEREREPKRTTIRLGDTRINLRLGPGALALARLTLG